MNYSSSERIDSMSFAFDSMMAWFLVSAAVIVATLVTTHTFTKRCRTFTSDLQRIARESSREVEGIIKERLSPTIHLHDGMDAVIRRAAHVISEVAAYDKSSDRIIEFFGAASLAAGETNPDRDAAEPGIEQKSPSRIYKEAIEGATKKHVLMKRYISLFTETQLRERSLRIQQQYLSWLKHQAHLLSSYERYELQDVVRAPNWGTNMARIITRKHVMEITGNGKAAIVITDEHIAQRINQYAHDSVIGKNPRNPPVVYGNSSEANGTLEAFESYVRMVEITYRDEQRKEQESLEEKSQDDQDATVIELDG